MTSASRSLPAFDPAHIWQSMRDSLVAIDAGLVAGGERCRMLCDAAPTLLREIHELEVVAVTALLRITQLHALPFAISEMASTCTEFFRRIDGAERVGDQLFAGLHLAHNLVSPAMGHVAIRADRAHSGAIRIVYGFADLLDDWRMTTGAKGLGVSGLHTGIEGTPEQDATDEAHSK